MTKFDYREFVDTAYHEAGHAIIGLINLYKVTSIKLIKSKHHLYNGYTYITEHGSYSKDKDYITFAANNYIKFLYGGYCADLILLKNISGSLKLKKYLKIYSDDDFLHIKKKLKSAYPNKTFKFKNKIKSKLIKETYADIEKYWSDVTLIAKALLASKNNSLSFSKIKKILLKSENKEFWKKQFNLIKVIY